ncbi:DUF1275 domain-containing protein [Pendulispora rubella]|uniref:DUF1275 domain-containing protein n=1 Tax=Pendulispora rubella TaxID=2741070 RepID=A0ABZ2KZW4_9BACT
MTFAKDAEIFAPRNVMAWLLFSLTAGSVNAGAFMACRNFVSHVTGTITSLGVEFGESWLALKYMLVFAAFFGGAAIAALVTVTLRLRDKQQIVVPMLLVFLVLLSVAAAGHGGLFGPFGLEEPTSGSFVLLSLLAAAMGIQNSAIGLATSNAIRTTHATGPVTDLAVNVVRAMLGTKEASAREWKWALLRSAKLTMFIGGALVTTRYASILEYRTFTISAMFLLAGVVLTGLSEVTRVGDQSVRL